MIALTDDVHKLFDGVVEEVSHNVRHLMEHLWLNWSHVGIEYDVRVNNIYKLVQYEKELHKDVLNETQRKLETMQRQVEELKEETKKLSEYLSVDIIILDYKENMMLFEYKKALEDQITEYREQMEQRLTEINRLLEWQHDLIEKLGVQLPELPDIPLPPQEEVEKLRTYLKGLQAERDKRAEIFLHTQIEIKDIMDKLQIRPQNKFEHEVVSSLSVDFLVTDLNMDRLAKLRQELQEKYDQTNNQVLELRERLSKLWECLDEDQIYRDNFLQAHPGCHPATETAIKEEINRCNQIKRQKIQVFVANMRTKIKLMWDNIMYSSKQREEFVHYYKDIFTEDTLSLHELYLDKITQYYNQHKHIFELVLTRKNLWLKQAEIDARASEPGRYHNRGGNLLREEKERKAIEQNLPKIEAQLREVVTDYESRTGNTFTVDGVPLLQLIEDEKESRKAERHNKLSARKQALTPTNPMFRSLATSPRGKRNRTAAQLPLTADRNRPPSKRQLITGSASKAVSALTHNMSALKRSAISTVKRRVSGRLAAKVIVAKAEMAGASVKRKLDYGAAAAAPAPAAPAPSTAAPAPAPAPAPTAAAAAPAATSRQPRAHGHILKHKRSSVGKRRSGGRRSSVSLEHHEKDPLMETTHLTSYTDFKDQINEKQVSRSSMALKPADMVIPTIVCDDTIEEYNSPRVTPMTSKTGKENSQNVPLTPKTNLVYTPTRLTRSASKLNTAGFATPRAPLGTPRPRAPPAAPRAPLSAAKLNVQSTNNNHTHHAYKNTPSNLLRSKTQTGLVRTPKPFL